MNTVYWSPWLIDNLSYIEYPEVTRLSSSIFKSMKGIDDPQEAYHKCPAVQGYIENVFELRSPVDFEIIRNSDGGFYTNSTNQAFWDDFIFVRNQNLLSFNIYYLMIPDFDVDIEVTSAHFTDNDFTRKTMIVPGKYNPYKWIRPLQCSFAIRDNVESIKLNRGDPIIYVKVCTPNKIKMKKFVATSFLNESIARNLKIKMSYNKKITPLNYWYELYESSKIRKKIMSEITANTLED